MKKRILYIILGVMLLSVKGMGQVVITPNYSTNYNGFPTQPPFTITGCCGEVKLFTDNSTGNSIGANAPINAGSYKLRITFTFGPNNTFFDEQNFTINKATPTLSVTNSPITYNANTQSATLSSSVAGLITNVKYNGSSTLPINAGTYTITADFAPTDASNYNSLTGEVAGNFTINKAPVTISDILLTKAYDGTPTVNVISNSSSGIISSDNVAIQGSATNFSDKIVANNYSSTVTFNLVTIPSTGKEDNYIFVGGNQRSISNGSITAKPITVTGVTTSNKVYDRTNVATLTGGTLDGVISPDVVNFTASGTFSQSTVGTGIAITSTSTIDNANYSLTQPALTARDITPKALTVTGATTTNKPYDRTNTASVTGGTLVGVITPDVVNLVQSGTFSQSTVGTGIAITSTSTIDNANYSLTQPSLTARDITPKALTVTGLTTSNKEYDRTNIATLTGGSLNGVISPDVVNFTASGTFSQSTVGTGIAITSTSTIDNANYSLTQPALTARDITPKALTVTGATTTNKPYDRTNTASVTGGTLVGVITPDVVNLVQSGTFSQSTVGTGIAITSTCTIDNTNYSLTQPTLIARDITPKALTVTGVTTSNKVYDRTNVATLTGGTLDGVISPDVVNLVQSGTFSQSTVGTGIAITSTSTIDNTNYSLTQPTLIARDITAKPLIVTGVTTSNKVYDRTNTANVTGGTLLGVISPDLVNLTQSGTFAQVNVGTGIAITSTSTIDNTNYRLTQPTLIARDITAKPLTVTATPGQTKVFGAVDPPNFTYTLSAPLLGSDVLNGALKRDAGEAIGSYPINQGTLTNLNYDIIFVGNNFVITPAPVNNTGTTKPYDLPNAFTPNGDGKNDEFKIIVNNPSGVTLISFQIYNRNGTLIFSTNKISEGWDGRYKGIVQDMGIYFVKLITSENGLDTRSIYLLK